MATPSLQDVTLPGQDFASNWDHQRETVSCSVQTDVVSVKNRRIGTVDKVNHVKTQTEPASELVGGQEWPEVPDAVLSEMLSRTSRLVEQQLVSNLESHAFDTWEPLWDDEQSDVTCIQSMRHAELEQGMGVLDVSWNAAGSVLASAHGRLDHTDWCVHRGAVCIWYPFRRAVSTEAAETVLDVPSCVTCVAFHPEKHGLVAAGTFSGQVYVWNLNKLGDPVCSNVQEVSHREPVSSVVWAPDPAAKPGARVSHVLISTSADGKLLQWTSENSMAYPMRGMMMRARDTRQRRYAKVDRAAVLGATALAVSPHDSSTAILGTEDGGLWRCSLTTRGASAKLDKDLPASQQVMMKFPCPMTFAYTPMTGPVYGLAFSPSHRNVFATVGIEGSVRLHTTLHANHVHEIFLSNDYLFCVAWSPFRPLVFAVAGAGGRLYLCDLAADRSRSVVSLQTDSTARATIHTVAFNAQTRDILVTGDASGSLQLWRLSSSLCRSKPTLNEQVILDGISQQGAGGDEGDGS